MKPGKAWASCGLNIKRWPDEMPWEWKQMNVLNPRLELGYMALNTNEWNQPSNQHEWTKNESLWGTMIKEGNQSYKGGRGGWN